MVAELQLFASDALALLIQMHTIAPSPHALQKVRSERFSKKGMGQRPTGQSARPLEGAL